MGVPHIVLGLLAVFFAYDSQQNISLAASDLSYGDEEPHHITVPVFAGTTSPAPQPALPPAPPDPPLATGRPFSIGGGPSPPLSAIGARVETPFSWLWWWWYFDLESRSSPRFSSFWTRWTSQGGLVGAVSAALFGDYTRSFWLVLAIAIIGIAFAGIGYCLWCCTHARAMCCSPCRCCGRRARIRDEVNPATLGTPEEAPPLRGPHGLRPTDNDLYASIKNVDRKRGGRPHVLVAAGAHTARLAQPEGGATPRANAHGVVLEFTDVISASSRRARTRLETASTSRVHLCREHPCRAEVDVALHATAYAPIDRDHPLDFRGESNPTTRRCRLPIANLTTCLAWTFRQTGFAGYRTGRGFSRLGSWCCCCARRSPADGSTPGEWKDSLSETECEPEDTRCQAHLVLRAGPSSEATGFTSKPCWDRALPTPARLIEEDACASGLGLAGSEPGTARLRHCHAKTYELERVKLKCAYQACYQLGAVHAQGLTLCGEHARAHLRAKPDPQEGARNPLSSCGHRSRRNRDTAGSGQPLTCWIWGRRKAQRANHDRRGGVAP